MNERHVLVTGASGGLGRATASQLASAGWTVYAGLRDPAAGGGEGQPRVRVLPLDVTDDESIAQCVETISAQSGGRLHAVVNNAGITSDGPLELLPRQSLRELFEVNVIGSAAVTAACLPLLRRTSGRIVNIGGAAGRSPLPYLGPLSSSKAALDSLSAVLRMELRRQRVSVTLIEPGAIDTPFFHRDHAAAPQNASSHAAHDFYRDAATAKDALLASPQDSPAEVARIIARTLQRRRPPARVVVGRQARWVLPVLRALPVDIRDRLVLRSLGIGPRS